MLINAGKEFLDVAFQHPASASVVLAHDLAKLLKAVQGFMRPFVDPARI